MAKKLAAICLVLVMVLTTLGASYATWTQNLITNATVSIAQAPEVVASGANANTTSAVLNGSLSQEAPGDAPVKVGFEYWKQGDSSNKTLVAAGSFSSLNSTFSASVAGLSPDTIYEYKTTGVGFFTVESAISTFTTGAAAVLEVTTSALPDGTVNSPYNQTLQASGGSGNYTGWAIIGGSLPPGLSLTDGNVISGTPTTANTYSVTFRVTDSTNATDDSVSLSLAINAAATKLAFSQQPTGTIPGTAISPTVTVRVEDTANNLITTSSALISIAINNNPSSGTLSGMQSVHAVNGVATFKYLSIDKAGIGYTLTASSSGLSSDTSDAFNIGTRITNYISIETLANGSGVVIPAQSFVAGDGGTITGFAIERDASGAFVANVSATWSLTNITGGLVNTDLVPSGDGKNATFSDTAHLVGTATLHAVWDGLSADSGRISITPNVINKLVVTLPGQIFTAGAGNAGTVTPQTAGHLFNIVSITATDTYFNIVTSYNGAKTIGYTGPAGTPSYTTAVDFTNGVSTTALATSLSNVETTTITVNDGTTTGPASSSLKVNQAAPGGVIVYVPIILTNTETTPVAGGTQVSLPINWNTYQTYLDNPVDNYVFFNSAGDRLYNWLESGTANTSTSAIVWLKLDSSGIPAKVGLTNGTITIYLGFYPKSTNKLGSNNNNYTGWAPNLSGTYGQYDNGANVFVNYYRGDSTSGWSVVGTAGTTAAAPSGSAFGTRAYYANGANGSYLDINSGYSTSGNYIIQYYTYSTILGNLFFSANSAGLGTMSRIDTRGSTNYSGFARTSNWFSWLAPITSTINSPSTWYQWSIVIAGNGTQIGDYYTTALNLGTLGAPINVLGPTYSDGATETYSPAGSYLGLVGDAGGGTTFWNGILIRVYPPNGVMPTSSTGSPVTTVTPATINVDSNINWSAITTGSGIGGQPSVFDTVNVGVNNNTTLTVDVANAVCADLNLGHHSVDTTGTLIFNNGSNLSVNNLAIGASGAGASGAGSITMTAGGTLNVAGTVTVNQAGTWAPGTGTVVYNSTGDQTLPGTFLTSYNNLTLSGNGAKTTTGATVSGILSIEGTATWTGTFPTWSGTAYTLQYKTTDTRTAGTEWANTFGGTGGVTIATTGTGNVTASANKVFNSTVPLTIQSGAILHMAANTLTLNGNLINNGGTLDSTATVTITGSANQDIGSFTTTGTVSMTKTAGTATLTGNVNGGALTINGTGGTLNLGSSLTHTFTGVVTLTAGILNGGSSTLNVIGANSPSWTNTAGVFTAGLGTVKLGAAGTQSLTGTLTTTFNNLTISGTSIKTLTKVPIVNGVLSLEGTATVSAAPTYGSTARLQYNTSTGRTAGVEWRTPFAATGGVIIANIGTITANGNKAFNVGIPLTIQSGSTLNMAASSLTLNGDLINNGGTLTGTGAVTIAGTATQSIGSFTTTGRVSMTKTGGSTATFTGNVNGGALTINGSGGTINLGSSLTHTFTGTWTRTAGTLDGGSSTLNLKGSTSGTGATFTASTGTVNYNGTIAQTVSSATYNILTINKSSGTATLGGTVSCTNLNLTAGTLDCSNRTLNIGGTVTTGGTFTASTGTVNYNGTTQTVATWTYYNLVFSGGAKSMATGTSVTTNGNLNIVSGAQASIGTGLNLTVYSLSFNGTRQVAGTWGYGPSTPPTNKNTTYFTSSTGYLTVTSN